jgi:hypothetical protein
MKATIGTGRGRRAPTGGGGRREHRAQHIGDPQPAQSSATIFRRRPRGSHDASDRGRVQPQDWDGLLVGGGGSAQIG